MKQIAVTELPDNILRLKPFASRLDASIAIPFKEDFLAIIEEKGKKIILDLSEVSFIDSSGLGAIVAAFKKIKPDGNLVLLTKSEAILTMLRLTRLDKVFQIVESKNILDALPFFE
ncbi:STAS domain-containing protein [bacterium]|nr:STAS domain-containing protein [bacterium]